MIEQLSESTTSVLAFKISGKVHDADYKTFVPIIDKAVAEFGKVRLLVQFVDFHGWDMHAVWDDTVFATTHCKVIERIALVGDKKWEEWMAKVCKPFTIAKIEYFDVGQLDAARQWFAAA